jgi:hypothetical protein
MMEGLQWINPCVTCCLINEKHTVGGTISNRFGVPIINILMDNIEIVFWMINREFVTAGLFDISNMA